MAKLDFSVDHRMRNSYFPEHIFALVTVASLTALKGKNPNTYQRKPIDGKCDGAKIVKQF